MTYFCYTKAANTAKSVAAFALTPYIVQTKAA